MRNLKIFMCILAISILFIWHSNQNSNIPTTTVTTSIATRSEKELQYDFKDCLALIGLTKQKLLNTFDEKPISLDENFNSFSRETWGLGFPESKIRVWFGDYGKSPIDQVYIYNKNIDINGLKVGDKISSFEKAFGNPLKADRISPYMNFKYEDKILSVYYNLKTEETYGVYIMAPAKYDSEFIEHKNNRYWVAGIEDPIEFEKNFNTLKDLVIKDNKEKVAEYILYPINIYGDKTKLEIRNKKEFIKNYDKIFNEEVKKAFIHQKVEETFVNYQGVMVNNGEIWFGAKRADPSAPEEYIIIAINHM